MRILTTILTLFAAITTYAQTTIWTGEKAIDWNTGGNIILSSSLFANAETADKIVFTFDVTGDASKWPQIAISNASTWKQLPGAGNIQLSAGMTTAAFTFTADMLSEVQEAGIVVSGYGFTCREIRIDKGPGPSGYEHSVWIGPVVVPSSWAAISVPASSFQNAKVGNTLRLRYTDAGASATHTIVDSNWKAIPGYGFNTMTGTYYDYTIDAALLSILKQGGCIINGCSYTMTSIDVFDAQARETLTASIPVTDNWIMTSPECLLYANITNTYATDRDAHLQWMVYDDHGKHITDGEKTVTIAAGKTEKVPFGFELTPGFYKVIPLLDGDALLTAGQIEGKRAASFFIGVMPEDIVSAPDAQPDFNDFWTQTKQQLATIAPEYKLTEITAKSTAKRKVYLLEYNSLPDANGNTAIARAYYAEPTDGKKHPVLLHFQGYDGGTGTPWCMGGNDNDYCEIIVSTRGQVINNRSPYTNPYGDWFAYGFDTRDHWYYRGAFMDCVRAVDFVCSRPSADTDNIFAEGTSQGGALTIATAALSDYPLRAIAPSVPFLGDYPDYFQIVGWPGNVAFDQQKKHGLTDSEMYTMLSYFDTKNLATSITCPVMMCVGLQDGVCPPHTNMAPYNNMQSTEKHVTYNPLLGHATSSTWWSEYNAFFRDHTVTEGIADITAAATASTAIYDLQGRRIAPSALRRNTLYIINGKKRFF